jgi:hypothetical protein
MGPKMSSKMLPNSAPLSLLWTCISCIPHTNLSIYKYDLLGRWLAIFLWMPTWNVGVRGCTIHPKPHTDDDGSKPSGYSKYKDFHYRRSLIKWI